MQLRRSNLRFVALALALFMVFGLVACGSGTQEPEESGEGTTETPTTPEEPELVKGGTLRVTYSSDPTSLDVQCTPSVGFIHAVIYETLVDYSPDRTYEGSLAESWTVSDDGTEIVFNLRPGIKFHDGTDFNAEAVKFNMDRLMDPELASPGASWVGTLEEVEVVDDLTVKFLFSEPYSPFFYSLSTSFLAIQSPTAIQEYGEDYGQIAAVGTGPYKFESWEAGARITMVRNEDFQTRVPWFENRGPAYFEKIVFYNMPDETTQMFALKDNEVDVIGVPTQYYKQLGKDENVEIYRSAASTVNYLGINASKAPWSNVELRKAVAHTIDREEIVQVALDGIGQPNATPIATTVFGYDPTLEDDVVYPKNIERAKSILEEQGYTDTDGDGWVDKDGQPLVLEILTYTSAPYPKLAEVVREQIIKAGIKAEIKTLESATLLASTPEGKHDAICIAYGWSDPDILYYFFHSSNLDRTNRVHYASPQVDHLLEKARTVVDNDARFAVYRELQEIIIKDAPWIPLYTPEALTGVRAEVEGFKLGPLGDYWIHDAYKLVTE